MAIAGEDIQFKYPEYVAEVSEDFVGGEPTDFEIPDAVDLEDGETQLFLPAFKFEGTHVQYHKEFIKNNSDEEALNCSVYGYNVNSNNMIKLALEENEAGTVYDGWEKSVNCYTEPTLYKHYTYSEYTSGSPLAISNVPAGGYVGIWLKLEFSTVGLNNIDDEFILGFKCDTGIDENITLTHSRLNAETDIVRWTEDVSFFNSVMVEFEQVDTSSLGINPENAYYGVYVDRIFKGEVVGTNRVPVELYRNAIPVMIEIFLLPYSGFRPELDGVPSDYQNRISLQLDGRNGLDFDVEKHFLYWDEATGTYSNRKICELDAVTNKGGGSQIDKITVEK